MTLLRDPKQLTLAALWVLPEQDAHLAPLLPLRWMIARRWEGRDGRWTWVDPWVTCVDPCTAGTTTGSYEWFLSSSVTEKDSHQNEKKGIQIPPKNLSINTRKSLNGKNRKKEKDSKENKRFSLRKREEKLNSSSSSPAPNPKLSPMSESVEVSHCILKSCCSDIGTSFHSQLLHRLQFLLSLIYFLYALKL